MPKYAESDASKIRNIVRSYPSEFQLTADSRKLYCKLCEVVVQHSKTFFVDSHRNSGRHKRNLKRTDSSVVQQQSTLRFATESFGERVIRAFLAANIPLHKLRNPALRSLFSDIGKPLPSESWCREKLSVISSLESERIKEIIGGKEMFMVTDETEINNRKYIHILVATVDAPETTYLSMCKELSGAVTAQCVVQHIDDMAKELGVHRDNFVLLLSDAAAYMRSAGGTLKILFPRLSHVMCVAHLLHNVSMRVRSGYKKTDELIAAVKAATVKNKTRRNQFAGIGYPPTPIITRWGSWISAAGYYAEKLPQITAIIDAWEDTGILVHKCKAAISKDGLSKELVEIQTWYSCLVKLLERVEGSKYTMLDASSDMTALKEKLNGDPLQVKAYLEKRLEKNELTEIVNLTRSDISPALYSKLQKCPPTSVTVERSFSMLNKLLASDRHFLPENLHKYMMLYYNSS